MARYMILVIRNSKIIKALETEIPSDAVETAITLATERQDAHVYLRDNTQRMGLWVQYSWSQAENNVIPRNVVIGEAL